MLAGLNATVAERAGECVHVLVGNLGSVQLEKVQRVGGITRLLAHVKCPNCILISCHRERVSKP